MGVVYEGIHISLGRRVAIKTLLVELSHDTRLAERFQQEARAASAIGHSHIVDVFDLGRTPDGIFYMVMELLVGQSLANYIANTPKLPIPLAIHFMAQVLSGLSAAHRHGIIHRDLKPENIFITQSEEHPDFVKIVDFGISKVLTHTIPGAKAGPGLAGTMAGTVMGTPLYMAPEQAIGQVEHIDHRTDLYAVGVVLYEILCGRTPFIGTEYPEIMAALLEGTYPAPRSLRPEIPEHVESVIKWALQRERHKRFNSAQAMRQALTEGENPRTPTPSPVVHSPNHESLAAVVSGEVPIELVEETPKVLREPLPERAGGSDPFAPLPVALLIPQPVVDLDHPLAARVSRSQANDSVLPIEKPIQPVEQSGKVIATLAPNHLLSPRQRALIIKGLMVLGLLIAARVAWIYIRPHGKIEALYIPPVSGDLTLEVEPETATVQVDHVPTRPGVLTLEPGKLHVINAAAPGRITRRFSFELKPGMVLSVRLAHVLTFPQPNDPPPRENELLVMLPENPRSISEIQRAFWKISIYESCLNAVMEGRGVGRNKAPSGDLMRYRAMTAKAEASTPLLPSLESAGRGYLSALHTGAKPSIVQRARVTLQTEILAQQVAWQMEALARQGVDGGSKAGWHMRRVALWAVVWLRATKAAPSQPDLVEKRKAEWEEFHQALVRFVSQTQGELSRVGGGKEFLQTASDFAEVLDGAKRSSDQVIWETARRLIEAHNALILES
jgi:serine/threonine protein kinase